MDLIAHIVAPYLDPRDCRALVVAWPKSRYGPDDLTRRIYTDLIVRVGLRPPYESSPREVYYSLIYGKYCDFCNLSIDSADPTSCASYFLCEACSDLWIHPGDRLNGINHDLDILSAVSAPLTSKLQRLLQGSIWVPKWELLTILEPLKRLTERDVHIHKSRLLWRFRGQVYEKRVHTIFTEELRRLGLPGNRHTGALLCNAVDDPINCLLGCSSLIQAYTATQEMLEALVAFDSIPQRNIRDIVKMQLQRKAITGEGALHDLSASRQCWEGNCSGSTCVLGSDACSQIAKIRRLPIPANVTPIASKRSSDQRQSVAMKRRRRLRCVA